jgi:hypothetical protein
MKQKNKISTDLIKKYEFGSSELDFLHQLLYLYCVKQKKNNFPISHPMSPILNHTLFTIKLFQL